MEAEVQSRLISLGLENSWIDDAESQSELLFAYLRSRVN